MDLEQFWRIPERERLEENAEKAAIASQRLHPCRFSFKQAYLRARKTFVLSTVLKNRQHTRDWDLGATLSDTGSVV